MKLLAIETSCDETAVAILNDRKEILAESLWSQVQEHLPYGGVVPEIAARAHIQRLDQMILSTLKKANLTFKDMDAIAATAGPGLIGGLIVGVMIAKAIASAANKPFIAVNHLEGHALTARLNPGVEFPFLLLLVSGGHCQILQVKDVGQYTKLGGTVDDAIGEAFDKVAKMLKIGYPGGPAVEKLARNGNPSRFDLPRPMLGRQGCDFSLSGLKTAVLRTLPAINTEQDKADLCASFQAAVGDIIIDRLKNAFNLTYSPPAGESISETTEIDGGYLAASPPRNLLQASPLQMSAPPLRGSAIPTLVVAGGVAANQYLRARIQAFCTKQGKEFVAPPMKLCTDNAVMIGWAAIERLKKGEKNSLDFAPLARWPLDALV